MKVSIITVCYNAEATIEETILSVLGQTHTDVEYIIIDGNSTDRTKQIIAKYRDRISHYISEPDKGIYDAMNKGLHLVTGQITGILNSDDIYKDTHVLSKIVSEFSDAINCVSTDVEIFKDNAENVVRYYSCVRWKYWMFRLGHQPPHPGFFARTSCYKELGLFNTKYKLGADFDLLLRFITHYRKSTVFKPWVSVSMRGGGASQKSLSNIHKANSEVNDSLNRNGFYSNILLIWLKYPLKLFQFIMR